MEPKRFTMVQHRRNTAERCMRRVTNLLRWSEMQYSELMFEYGIEYLETYLQGDKEMAYIISLNPVFWAWWKNHWTIREEVFLQDVEQLENIAVGFRRQAYTGLHNPRALAAEIHPNAVVLGDSYDAMMQTLIKTSAV